MSDYNDASWDERAQLFLADARNHLGGAGTLFQEAQRLAASVIKQQKDIDTVIGLAQVMATLGNAYMAGVNACLAFHTLEIDAHYEPQRLPNVSSINEKMVKGAPDNTN